jgi:hypothetical protein
MNCTVRFYKLNYDFSPEFAEAHHDGKPSENNRLYDWEDELASKSNVVSYHIRDNQSFYLQGEKDGEAFKEEINQMILFDFKDDQDQVTTMACSNSVVKRYEFDENGEELELNVYLEEEEPLTNPVPGVYVALQEFPESLI